MFKVNLTPGKAPNFYFDEINLNERPFKNRISGENSQAIATGIGKYAQLQANKLFCRLQKGETLTVKESFTLGYDIVSTAALAPGARVSHTVEALFLGEDGFTIEQKLGTDVRAL